MKKLATLHEYDIYPEREIPNKMIYTDRITGKAIILDAVGNIALVGNTHNHFLQLPGGGIVEGESLEQGTVRECLEEIGCVVDLTDEVGMIDDFRSRDAAHCITYCYVGTVLGKKGNVLHTQDESDIGMYTTWVDLPKAIQIFANQSLELAAGKVAFYNTGFNLMRDYLFLKEAVVRFKPNE